MTIVIIISSAVIIALVCLWLGYEFGATDGRKIASNNDLNWINWRRQAEALWGYKGKKDEHRRGCNETWHEIAEEAISNIDGELFLIDLRSQLDGLLKYHGHEPPGDAVSERER